MLWKFQFKNNNKVNGKKINLNLILYLIDIKILEIQIVIKNNLHSQ